MKPSHKKAAPGSQRIKTPPRLMVNVIQGIEMLLFIST